MRHFLRAVCCRTGLLLCLAGAARAQAPPDSARYVLPPLDVISVRGQLPTEEAVTRVVRISRTDLVAMRTTSLADALERRGGAFVRRYGPGGLASLSLRGSSAGQTALLLDGLRLNDPQLGQVDLSLLPAGLLGGAAVVHGAASAWHGSDAVGGAVLLDARRPEALDLRLEGGPYGTGHAEAAAGTAVGAMRIGISASVEASSGRFRYTDRTRFPARRATREGAGRRLGAVLGTLQAARGAGLTTGGLWVAAAERGLPGPAGVVPAGEQQDDALARLWATHQQVAGRIGLRVSAWAQAGRLRYRHPGLRLDETSRTRTVGGEVEARIARSRATSGGLGMAASRATARHPSLTAARPEIALAAFGHVTRTWHGLTAAAALRLDRYAQVARTYTPVSPRVGARLALARGWALKAGAGRSFRAPTLNDRFWQGAGRPDLRPEQGWSVETGLAFERASVSAEATAFVHALRDEILWQPSDAGVWRPENVRRTRTQGLEASIRGTRGRFSGNAFGTLVLAQDRSVPGSATYGQQLRFVPRSTARGDLGLALPVRHLDGLRLDVSAQAVGGRPVTTDRSQSLPPYVLLGAGGAGTWKGFTLDVRIENLLDAEYRVLEGYPMPGRELIVGLRYTR